MNKSSQLCRGAAQLHRGTIYPLGCYCDYGSPCLFCESWQVFCGDIFHIFYSPDMLAHFITVVVFQHGWCKAIDSRSITEIGIRVWSAALMPPKHYPKRCNSLKLKLVCCSFVCISFRSYVNRHKQGLVIFIMWRKQECCFSSTVTFTSSTRHETAKRKVILSQNSYVEGHMLQGLCVGITHRKCNCDSPVVKQLLSTQSNSSANGGEVSKHSPQQWRWWWLRDKQILSWKKRLSGLQIKYSAQWLTIPYSI